jgi:tRNA-dihydrouridine synthase B
LSYFSFKIFFNKKLIMQKNKIEKFAKGAFLAPMADYTNIAFRTLAKEYGASVLYTELISCKSIIYKNKKTKEMLKVNEKEKPVFLQLFGNNPEDFKEAIKIVEEKFDNFIGYDLNCGCSVPKAMKGQYGSYLMDYPKLVGEIINAMCSSTEKPVTIKMRLGREKEKFIEVAKEAEKNGAEMVCLHARLGSQMYSGKANWEKIKELKKAVKIPVIGNGDVCSVDDYIKMKKETNCDYVMVGRGAIGNAFIFKQIKKYEDQANSIFKKDAENKILKQNKNLIKRTKKDFYEEGNRFLELGREFNLGVNDLRPYFIGFANGFNGAKKIRNSFATAKEINDLEKILKENFYS